MGERVAIIGMGQTDHRYIRPDVSHDELINEAVKKALDDAELTIKDIDTVIVDNKDSGFDWGGPTGNRQASSGGYGTGFFWTYNTTSVPVNSGKWTPSLKSGDYEVFAYIPSAHATTRSARYRIYHDGAWSNRFVNQNIYSNAWVSLGTYHFDGSGQEYVLLCDNTSESAGSTQIAFDAIKFVKR